jgi:hypothetical protein
MKAPQLAEIQLMLATDYHAFSKEGWMFELNYGGCRPLQTHSPSSQVTLA